MAELSGLILLVEDDELLAGTVQRYLRARGYRVRVVASVAEAATALRQELPSLILLDINLPGETGWSLLDDPLLQTDPAPPAIVVSAGRVSPRQVRESGAAGHLAKPYSVEALLGVVERYLSPPQR